MFKSFATEELALEFARNHRDLTVANLSEASRRNNGAVSKRYYGIFKGRFRDEEVSDYVTDTEGRMKALILGADGAQIVGAIWKACGSYEDARAFAKHGHGV